MHSGHSRARASGLSRPTRGQLPTWKPPSPAKPKPHLSLGALRIPTEWKGRASGAPGAKPPALPYPTLFTHTLREGGRPTGNRHPPCQHAQQQGTLDRTCSNPKATLPHPSTHPHRAGRGGALSLAVSQGPSPHSLATPSQTVLPQQSPSAPGLPSWTALGSGVDTQFSLPRQARWGPTRNPHPTPTCFSGFATPSSHQVLGLGALPQPRSLTLKQGPSQQEAQPAARQSLTGPAG